MQRQLLVCLVVTLLACFGVVQACTNLLVQKSASSDNSNIIAYNADAANFYTTIYHYPAGHHTNGTMRKVWSWE
jgi:dipeptidase